MTEHEQRAMAQLYLSTVALIDGDGYPRSRPRLAYLPPSVDAPPDEWLPTLAAIDLDGDYRPGWTWPHVWEVVRGHLVEDGILPQETA